MKSDDQIPAIQEEEKSILENQESIQCEEKPLYKLLIQFDAKRQMVRRLVKKRYW